MQKLKVFHVDRLFVMLCMALALVYAGASTSQVIDTIQHAPVQVTEHEHSVFSNALTAQAGDHADDNHADETDDEQAPDHLAGGHHHHGDTGPSLIAGAADELANVVLFESLHASIRDRQVIGIAVPGPERPPRQMTLAA